MNADSGVIPTLTTQQILVVEDETEIRDLMSLLLLRQGYRVQTAGTADEAKEILKKQYFDLLVLDWMLPQMSGLEFLKSHLSSWQQKPTVLMVTAKSEPQDIVIGLEAGADDYLTKPFEPNVFLARIRALLRRQSTSQSKPANEDILIFGDMKINLASYEVICAGQSVHLTPSEFKILAQMAQNQGRVLTRDYLINSVQGDGITVTGRTIDTHVFGLRKKLGECANWVETIRGVGYRIKTEI